jgi:hypothetical protein
VPHFLPSPTPSTQRHGVPQLAALSRGAATEPPRSVAASRQSAALLAFSHPIDPMPWCPSIGGALTRRRYRSSACSGISSECRTSCLLPSHRPNAMVPLSWRRSHEAPLQNPRPVAASRQSAALLAFSHPIDPTPWCPQLAALSRGAATDQRRPVAASRQSAALLAFSHPIDPTSWCPSVGGALTRRRYIASHRCGRFSETTVIARVTDKPIRAHTSKARSRVALKSVPRSHCWPATWIPSN